MTEDNAFPICLSIYFTGVCLLSVVAGLLAGYYGSTSARDSRLGVSDPPVSLIIAFWPLSLIAGTVYITYISCRLLFWRLPVIIGTVLAKHKRTKNK